MFEDNHGFYNTNAVQFITKLPNGKARLHFAGNGFADTDTNYAEAVEHMQPVTAASAAPASPATHE